MIMMSDSNIIDVYHSKLKRLDNSSYKSECPFCEDGLFLLGRNMETNELDEFDICISCGKMIVYKDINDIKKRLT